MVRFIPSPKKLLLILGLSISLFIFPSSVFSANTEFRRTPGAGEPWHLALADPEIFRIKIYKVYLVKDDNTEVTLYENPNGVTIELMNAQFVPVSDTEVPPGHYKQIKVIISRTFGLKGYCYFTDNNPGGKTGYWYTKDTTDQSNIGFSATIPTSAADYGTQIATIDNPGTGSEIGPVYEGQTTFRYYTDIDLTINAGEKPRIRAEFDADNILELSDNTPNNGGDGGSPAQITFEDIPPVIISTQ